MDLAGIQATIKLWIATITRIDPLCVVMEDEQRPFVDPSNGGPAAYLSWVSMPDVGLAESRQATNDEDATAILASGGASALTAQVYTGAALNGSIGQGAIDPPGLLEITFSQSADWDGTTAVTVKGLDPLGIACVDSFDVTPGAIVSGGQLFSQVAEIDVPAQLGTGGTFTTGIAESTTAQMLTDMVCSLQIGIETFSQDPTQNGFFLLQKLRGLMRAPSSLAILEQANLGLIDMDATVKADYRVDDRWISRAVATVQFNLSDLVTDTQGTTQTVDAVLVTSQYENGPDGNPAPPVFQWDDHQIGPA